ncbi:tetratricopeptide repeat protein [Ovoidimarina sediminis]|uniref:tetratricopeptide repeat protein n=1 Tax=Ovoidimarina sediminis TaxID=3079856 RepID=UPI00290D841D|nr:tetratricopeptide repeat protein [Rhodophyticola sp. MJ-SS7]MDU8942958.1 tetratricopeptide repeat protein [Rhodophyticola sp. MJ-SS7]
MHRISLTAFCVASAFALTACAPPNPQADVERALATVNALDENNMSDLMLNSADPKEAVRYFRRSLAQDPDRPDFKRGLGISLLRSGAPTEAVAVLSNLVASPDATNEDRVFLADALIRAGKWDEAEQILDTIPPTYETFQRYRLEAMVADSNKQWSDSDSFYETALGMTTKPSSVLNNWGYSKLSRGDFLEAERLFGEALVYSPDLFTAKNNLVLARGAQRKYELPVVPMTQTERAQLLHTLGLSAIKQGDVAIGKGLLRDALETHPQYFEAAARSLEALEANVAN